MIGDIINDVREKKPLVHNITNYVTANDCANIVLASGGSPIMADDPCEVEEITAICNSLVINMGTLSEKRLSAMILSGIKANKMGIPVVLDPVGIGASKFRRDSLLKLLSKVKFTAIRGNLSEMKMMALGINEGRGVDTSISYETKPECLCDILEFSKRLSVKTGAVIAVTGPVDIVTDGIRSCYINNGTPYMGKITGAGCMLTSIIGTFLGCNSDYPFESVTAAIGAMGLCGEKAFDKVKKRNEGTGSFKTYLIDSMSLLDKKSLEEGIHIESM